MSMQVEIYDERELDTSTLATEPDAEALAIIDELGLTNQKTGSGARLNYPKPTEDQSFVMSVLFSEKTKLEAYDAGGIPLRVLKEIRNYRAENPTHRLYVLHAPPAQVKDPVLIACDGQHEWQDGPRMCRLIARWGDGLESWDKLMGKATKRFTASYDGACAGIIAQLEVIRASIKAGVLPSNRDGALPWLNVPTTTGNRPF